MEMAREGNEIIPFYSIREVFYDSDGTVMTYTAHPIKVEEQSIESLRITLNRMLKCLDNPILELDEKSTLPHTNRT
jgi:hypothetical protein